MVKITLGIDGMACGMCEAHINDTVRASFKVKKVTSSHSKGKTVIVAENEIDESALKYSFNFFYRRTDELLHSVARAGKHLRHDNPFFVP